MSNLSPKQIVTELDKYIVGQDKAKRAGEKICRILAAGA